MLHIMAVIGFVILALGVLFTILFIIDDPNNEDTEAKFKEWASNPYKSKNPYNRRDNKY